MRLIAIIFLLTMLSFFQVTVEGRHCFKDHRACGRGTRCMYGHYCVGLCKPRGWRPKNRNPTPQNCVGPDCVEISYKEPFKHMMTDVGVDIEHDINKEEDNQKLNKTSILQIFKEIDEEVSHDAADCDSDEIEDIAKESRSARTDMEALIDKSYAEFANKAIQHFEHLKNKFLQLDDSKYACVVQNTSHLASPDLKFGANDMMGQNWNTRGKFGVEMEENVPDQYKCAEICFRRSECRYFTWYKSGPMAKQCITMEGASHKYWDSTAISGDHHAGPLTRSIPLCPEGWTMFNGLCYKYEDTLFPTWSSARSHCQAYGADLATIPSTDIKDFLLTSLLPNRDTGHKIWIGGMKNSSEGWKWVDEVEFSMENMNSANPSNDESYMEMNVNGEMKEVANDDPDSESNHALCQGWLDEIENLPINGGWGSWSSYNSCSRNCGGGTQRRTRYCNNPSPAYGGASCSGSSTDSRSCNTHHCPINGGWGSWFDSGSCSKTCGGGQQHVCRYCNNPSPAYGGASCSGSSSYYRSCNTHRCPRKCRWWSFWNCVSWWRGMIDTDGKQAVCKSILEDLKELKKKTASSQNRKKMLMKKMKKYCFQRNSANDKKFLTSLDKFIRKEKKEMEANGNNEE